MIAAALPGETTEREGKQRYPFAGSPDSALIGKAVPSSGAALLCAAAAGMFADCLRRSEGAGRWAGQAMRGRRIHQMQAPASSRARTRKIVVSYHWKAQKRLAGW